MKIYMQEQIIYLYGDIVAHFIETVLRDFGSQVLVKLLFVRCGWWRWVSMIFISDIYVYKQNYVFSKCLFFVYVSV